MSTEERRRAAAALVRRGAAVIPVPSGKKNPDRTGWEALRISEEEIPRYWTNGQNIGLLTGESSGWRVDVDLDADEAVRSPGGFCCQLSRAGVIAVRTLTGGLSRLAQRAATGKMPTARS